MQRIKEVRVEVVIEDKPVLARGRKRKENFRSASDQRFL